MRETESWGLLCVGIGASWRMLDGGWWAWEGDEQDKKERGSWTVKQLKRNGGRRLSKLSVEQLG